MMYTTEVIQRKLMAFSTITYYIANLISPKYS